MSMNLIPCCREFFVVYAVQEPDGGVRELVEDPVVAWYNNDEGVLEPIPADQLFADDNYSAIRLGDLYYGDFGSGFSKDQVINYFDKSFRKQAAAKEK